MAADALCALLGLVRRLTVWIQVRFVMSMPEQDEAAPALEIEFDDSRGCVV
jgi:hypothetical protein